MKDAIWEYLELSDTEKEKLWSSATFVFDANVLLNLYRYSAKTREALFNDLKSLNGKLWIPHQVAFEYAKNRCDVIYETVGKYESLKAEADRFIKSCFDALRLNDTEIEKDSLKTNIYEWLETQKSSNLKVLNPSNDDVLNKLLVLFNGKVGERFSSEKILEIENEGKERYAKQIPPGYCDSSKEQGGNTNNSYGDLIVWLQIIENSKKNNNDIIFVTHDQKEDWWNKVKGKTIGPRIELRKEFKEKTGHKFHMYSMDSFIKHCSELTGIPTDQSVIDEVKQMNLKRIFSFKDSENNSAQNNMSMKQLYATGTFEEMLTLENEIAILKNKIERQYAYIDSINRKYEGQEIPPNIQTIIFNTQRNIVVMQNKLIDKENEYSNFKTMRNSNYHFFYKSDGHYLSN